MYEALAASSRSPLTVEEGIALLTYHPDVLKPNRCFPVLGSRADDERVVVFWRS